MTPEQEILIEKERKMEMKFLLKYVRKGKWKGHRRGIEYVTTIDQDILYIDGNQIRIRCMFMVHSQFLSTHFRFMVQYQEKMLDHFIGGIIT